MLRVVYVSNFLGVVGAEKRKIKKKSHHYQLEVIRRSKKIYFRF